MKATKHTLTTHLYLEIAVEVEGFYTPFREGRFYLSNGDPGYESEDAEFEITKVTCCTTKPNERLDITNILMHSDLSSLQDECIEQISEPYESEDYDRDDDRDDD